MGYRLTRGELRVVRAALMTYDGIKRKEGGLKKNAGEDKVKVYQMVYALIESTIEAFDGDDVTSVYVNRTRRDGITD